MDKRQDDFTKPKVFISYSHDSNEHKSWVVELATNLRTKGGIDVILDEWETDLGSDFKKFMEKSVTDSDRVIMICSNIYTNKVDEGIGGAGYEAMIVTKQIIKDQGIKKFIPLVAPDNTEALMPNCLSNKKYVDFRVSSEYKKQFGILVESLRHYNKYKKPKINLDKEYNDNYMKTSKKDGKYISDTKQKVDSIFYESQEICLANNFNAWQEISTTQKNDCYKKLCQYREEHEFTLKINKGNAIDTYLSIVDIYEPLFALVAGAINSHEPDFSKQLVILSELIYPKNWEKNGNKYFVDIPKSLGFIFQALYGASYANLSNYEQISDLANHKTINPMDREILSLAEDYELFAYPPSLEFYSDLRSNLYAICELFDRWSWLKEIFLEKNEFLKCVSVYYFSLSIIRMIKNYSNDENIDDYVFSIPPFFLFVDREVRIDMVQKALNDKQSICDIWRNKNINDTYVISKWEKYLERWGSYRESRIELLRVINFVKDLIKQISE